MRNLEARQFGVETYLSLKASFRDLVKLSGGVTRAVSLTRGCQSKMSEAMAPTELERFAALDQIADLEAECGEPVVTRVLAQMAGFDLVPVVASAAPAALMHLLAGLVLKTSDVNAQLAAALADGTVDDHEIASLLSATRSSIVKLHELEAALMSRHKLQAVR